MKNYTKHLGALLALCLVGLLAVAGPYDLKINQRNAADDGDWARLFPTPPSDGDGIMFFNGATKVPGYLTVGSGLSVSSGVLNATGAAARSFSYPTRTLDTCYQPSSTRDAQVSYNVTINTTSTLTAGGVGTVYLEAFTNSGCTTGTQEIGRFVNGNTQTLGLTVTMVQNVTGNLNGIVPAGMWVKQRTQINTGTSANVTFTALPGQETLL